MYIIISCVHSTESRDCLYVTYQYDPNEECIVYRVINLAPHPGVVHLAFVKLRAIFRHIFIRVLDDSSTLDSLLFLNS